MRWIALLCPAESLAAWGWWCLQFTPRVAQVDEALVLEVSASERLFGGRARLLGRLLRDNPLEEQVPWAGGPTSLAALALLRCKLAGAGAGGGEGSGNGATRTHRSLDSLPLDALTAAREHVPMLARAGCATWGQLRALPRAGVSRRFGAALLDALDRAYGDRPESHAWLGIPEVFDMKVELLALATAAPELLWSGQRLLSQFQLWLRARQRGVLALELEWTLDLKRLDGRPLPPHESLVVRTAQPTQDMTHLRRLLGEHLARATLSAPASHLRLRSLETVPWAGASTSLLPEDTRKGDRLHELVERLSVRLGAHNVLMLKPRADWRPECMQAWVPAREVLPHVKAPAVVDGLAPPDKHAQPRRKPRATEPPAPGEAGDALYPAWLLPEPLRLAVRGHRPQYLGQPLRRLVRMYRVEAGWWESGRAARRDYFIARSASAGLVWIYQEHVPLADKPMWFLQGLYA